MQLIDAHAPGCHILLSSLLDRVQITARAEEPLRPGQHNRTDIVVARCFFHRLAKAIVKNRAQRITRLRVIVDDLQNTTMALDEHAII